MRSRATLPIGSIWRGATAGLLLAMTAGWSWRESRRADVAQVEWVRLQAEWRRLMDETPAPTAATSAQLEAAGRRAMGAVRQMRHALGVEGVERSVPQVGERAEAYLVLLRFMQTQREAASAAGVALPPDPAFGFSAYTNQGPESELIAPVLAQMVAAESLLQALWAVRPERFERLQRETPSSGSTAGSDGRTTAGPVRGDDHWIWPEDRSLRRTGILDTLAFRIEFTGDTGTLRRYLRALKQRVPPVAVRQVEAEPAEGVAAPALRTLTELFGEEAPVEDGAPMIVPVVVPKPTRFRVVVECLRFRGGAEFNDGEEAP